MYLLYNLKFEYIDDNANIQNAWYAVIFITLTIIGVS